MEDAEVLSVAQMQAWLEASQEVRFVAQGRKEAYAWVERVLVQRQYGSQDRKDRGVVRGLLVEDDGEVGAADHAPGGAIPGDRTGARGGLPAAEICAGVYGGGRAPAGAGGSGAPAAERAGHAADSGAGGGGIRPPGVRAAGQDLSGALVQSAKETDYRKQAACYEATRPTQVSIAERRRPDPQGRPGYLRVDTVHQGDWDGHKGVYHINSVDAVTQWEVLGCIPTISAEYLKILLEALMAEHPAPIVGFHVDNGSEYINRVVAKLLSDSLVEFTKSRAYQSCDNALVEGKNGAIIRKHIGYGHIGPEHATRIQEFYIRYLNPYLNYHRPCGFATVTLDAKGKRRRQYPLADYATPYEKLKSLREGGAVLRPGLTWEALEQTAKSASDTEFAERMRRAKVELLRKCKMESPVPPRWEV
jgi:transposase InsO family protein